MTLPAAPAQRLLIGAWWGPRPCTAAEALRTLGHLAELLAELPGGVAAWALPRAHWDAPERLAWAQGRWQAGPEVLLRSHPEPGAGSDAGTTRWNLRLVQAGWTAAAGRRPDDPQAASLAAQLGSGLAALGNHVVLELWCPGTAGPARADTEPWQACHDALLATLAPQHAVVTDWTEPDPLDERPLWERDQGPAPSMLLRYPPRQGGAAAAARARLQAAARHLDRTLAQAAARGDTACRLQRERLAPLLAALQTPLPADAPASTLTGSRQPPPQSLYRAHWHSEDPQHGQGSRVFAAESALLSALNHWPAQAWYPAGTAAAVPPGAAPNPAPPPWWRRWLGRG